MSEDQEEVEVDLPTQRRARATQLKAANRLNRKLQTLLETEDPATLSLHQLQERETELETIKRRAIRANDSLVEEELDEALQAEDEAAWDTFQESTELATRRCQELIALRVVTCLVEEVDHSLNTLQFKIDKDPTLDYSEALPNIEKLLQEVNKTLRESTIPADHNLRVMAKELVERLNNAQAKKVMLPPPDIRDTIKRETSSRGKL